MQPISEESWYQYLSPGQQKLVKVTSELLKNEKDLQLDDYSFIVFSMAKAYEGFLKKLLLELGLISYKVYQGRKFRIGRALNPDIKFHQRDKYWLYDDVADKCGRVVAESLWKTWLTCRNRVFHFFPKEQSFLTYLEAKDKVQQIEKSMSKAVSCLSTLQ